AAQERLPFLAVYPQAVVGGQRAGRRCPREGQRPLRRLTHVEPEGGSYGIWTVHDTVAPARAQSLRRAPVGSATAPLGGRTRLQRGLGGRAAHGPLETPPRARSPRRPGTPADQPDTHW